MSNELIIDSLQRRMKALHSLYDQALSTMTIEHVNHFEREGVLPIAFSLFHITNMIDSSFMLITGQMPVWNDEWNARVMPAIANKHGVTNVVSTTRVDNAFERCTSHFNISRKGPGSTT